MKILALESSALSASAAICSDGILIAEIWQRTGLTHSETLLPMAQELLKSAGIPLADIDLFAVSAGPGSFTGLRIGVSAAKAVAGLHMMMAQNPIFVISGGLSHE